MKSDAMIFYSIFMSGFSATCIGLASYKLIMFVRAKGCQESIPQTILIFEIIANFSKRPTSTNKTLSYKLIVYNLGSTILSISSGPPSISSVIALYGKSNVLHHELAIRNCQFAFDKLLLVRNTKRNSILGKSI